MNNQIAEVLSEISELRNKLKIHPVYSSLKTVEDVKIFMQIHAFAVWDFMSLLKALQKKLTCVNVPWLPSEYSKAARLINQIVVDEESDLNVDGLVKSHFEMYIEAMEEISADTTPINTFLNHLSKEKNILLYIDNSKLDDPIKNFLKFTFNTIQNGKTHEIASAFTFGREEIIPDMFLEIVKNTEKKEDISLRKINYYLERHIELDGDEHGPLAHEMISDLCDNDVKWKGVVNTSKKALELRISLWDYINNEITSKTKKQLSKDLIFS